MRVLFITSRLPWPPVTGRKTSLFYHLRGLASRPGMTVGAASLVDEPSQLQGRPTFLRYFVPLSHPRLWRRVYHTVRYTVGRNYWPIQTALCWSKENAKIVRASIARFNPDVVVGDTVRTAPYLFDDLAVARVLQLDDLLSRRYERQLMASGAVDIIGEYSKQLPISFLPLVRVLARTLLAVEIRRVRRAEREWPRAVEAVTLVSPLEVAQLSDQAALSNVYYVPPAVDGPTRLGPFRPERDGARLVFVGAFSMHHNFEAARELCTMTFPALLAKGCPVSLILAGRNADRLAKYATHPDIRLMKDVEDMSTMLRSAHVFVAPLRTGSGTKLKLIEAMANGGPIVTTSIGAEGLVGLAGTHYMVRDDVEGFVDGVRQLIHSSDQAAALRSAARRLFESEYSEAVVADRLFAVLESAIATRAREKRRCVC